MVAAGGAAGAGPALSPDCCRDRSPVSIAAPVPATAAAPLCQSRIRSSSPVSGHIHPAPLTSIIFQMFVRLFVDENLDRHVPISKQPKEKIQAIIDSCTRQFPDCTDRARGRIRAYLKSCRRARRSGERAGLDTNSVRTQHTKLFFSVSSVHIKYSQYLLAD